MQRQVGTRGRSLVNDLSWNALLFLIALAVLASVSRYTFDLSDLFLWKALGAFLVGGSLVLALAFKHLLTTSFGPANQMTLARGGLIALLFGLLGENAPATSFAASLGCMVLVLDGLDGWLARRFKVATRFGARFDMETDSLLMLALASLAWQYQQAGSWILLAGFIRYLFVMSGYAFPRLRRPLPPSRRRQTICVTGIVSLIICLSPLVTPPVSRFVALTGLLLLVGSFAVDTLYLCRDSRNIQGCSELEPSRQ